MKMESQKIKRKTLGVIDASFLHMEKRSTPMHVAVLMTFRLPNSASKEFVHDVVASLRDDAKEVQAPWNQRLSEKMYSNLIPITETYSNIDLTYHVRHSCLPSSGGERELGELVSHLHSQLLDRSVPLWTCHVIEGLSEDRFAIYLKMHHALTDGVNGIRMATRCLSSVPSGDWCAPWHYMRPVKNRNKRGISGKLNVKFGGLASTFKSGGKALVEMSRPYTNVRGTTDHISIPFQAPHCSLNGTITAARRVATQQFDMERIRLISNKTNTSVNDIFLTVCSTALKRHLESINDLPVNPLIAGVPVSLREEGVEGGNAIGFVWASLATDESSSISRLESINASMTAAKEHLGRLPKKIRPIYTAAYMVPTIALLVSGLITRTKPPMNLTISNVPGPEGSLFMEGAELCNLYPISIPLQGLALNITAISYAGKLNVGFTGSRDNLPHLQRLAVYAEEALSELELETGQ